MRLKNALRLMALVCAAVSQAAHAQAPQGVLNAADFNEWIFGESSTPTTGTIVLPLTPSCNVTSHGYSFSAARAGRPLRINDANPANSETVVPTSVSAAGNFCTIQAPMAHSHSSYTITSGTFGLQEALDFNGNQPPSVVVVGPDWTKAGGTTAMIQAATGYTGVSISDERAAPFAAYTWSGSNFVQATSGNGGSQAAGTCPYGASYTVGAQAVTTGTVAMIDGSGNAAPGLNITVSTAGSYIGVFAAAAQPGQQVCVQQAGIATVNFSNTPTIGSIAMTQAGSNLAYNSGSDSLAASSPRMPAVGTVIGVSGSSALVQINGLGVFGSGNFLVDNSNVQRSLPYAGLNMLTENATSENGVWQVAGFLSGLINGYTPGQMATLGTGDGTTATFSLTASGILPQAFTVYVGGAIVPSSGFTTSGLNWTFKTPPAQGATVQVFADGWDLTKAAAEAALASTGKPQAMVMAPGINYTCTDTPFTQNGNYTTSVYGWGHNSSILKKRGNCGVQQATLYQPATSAGSKTGNYQGFTVDASGIDTHAIDVFSMQRVTFSDVLGEAPGGTDQVITIGGPTAAGWTYNFYGYGLKAFERTQHLGKNNDFTLTWSNGQLQSVTYNDVYAGQGNANDSYSQFTQLLFFGPGLVTCNVQPQVTPNFTAVTGTQNETGIAFNYANLANPTITNPGQCTDTANIHLTNFDSRVAKGIYFQNVTDSVLHDTEVYGVFTQAPLYMENISSNNTLNTWHDWSGSTACFDDRGSGNKWTDGECDSPSSYVFIADGPGSYVQGISLNEDTAAYQGVTGIWYRNNDNLPKAQGWHVSNFICTYSTSLYNADPSYTLFMNNAGGLSPANPINSGFDLSNVELCDGSLTVIARVDANNAMTSDGQTFGYLSGAGLGFGSTALYSSIFGVYPDRANSMLWFRNRLAGSGASGLDPDGLGIDSLGQPSISAPWHGTIVTKQVVPPGAPAVGVVGTQGTSNYSYACVASDTNGFLTSVGASGSTALGNAALSSTNYNTITCPFTEGFKAMNVCRLANDPGLGQGYIGQINKGTFEKATGNFLKDTGQAAGSAALCPSVNNTGQIVTALASGSSVSLTPTTETVSGVTPALSGTTNVSNFAPTAPVTSFTIGACGYDGQHKVWHITSGATAYAMPASAPTNVRNYTTPTLTPNKDTDLPLDCFAAEGIWVVGNVKTY